MPERNIKLTDIEVTSKQQNQVQAKIQFFIEDIGEKTLTFYFRDLPATAVQFFSKQRIAQLLLMMMQTSSASYPVEGYYYLRDDNTNNNQTYWLTLNEDHMPSDDVDNNCLGVKLPYLDLLNNFWRYNISVVNLDSKFIFSFVKNFYQYNLADKSWYVCKVGAGQGPYNYAELYANQSAIVSEDFLNRLTLALADYYGDSYDEYRKLEDQGYFNNATILILIGIGSLITLCMLYLARRPISTLISKIVDLSCPQDEEQQIELKPKKKTTNVKRQTEHTALLKQSPKKKEPQEVKKTAITIPPQKIIKLPKNIVDLIKQAERYKASNEFEFAEKCYDSAIALDATCEEALYQKGLLLQSQRSFMKAFDCFKKILELNKHHANAVKMLVYILLHNKKPELALTACEEFLQDNPVNFEIHQLKCTVLFEQAIIVPLDRVDEKIAVLLAYTQSVIELLPELAPKKFSVFANTKPKEYFLYQYFYSLKYVLFCYLEKFDAAIAQCALTDKMELFDSSDLDYAFLHMQNKNLSAVKSYLTDKKKYSPREIQIRAFLIEDKDFQQQELQKAETEAEGNNQLLILLLFERGLIYQSKNMTNKAIECYERVLQCDKSHLPAKLHLKKIATNSITKKKTKIQDHLNEKSLPIQLAEIETKQKLYETNFSVVYRANWRNQSVALKQSKDKDVNKFIEKEVLILKKIESDKHVNIISMLGFSLSTTNYFILFEYMEFGSLHQLFHQHNKELSTSQIESIALDIAKGLKYLHQQDIVHRDLKSLNILMEEKAGNLRARISDFGLSEVDVQVKGIHVKSFSGTARWAPPDALQGQVIPAVDIYSYGVVLWEMMTRCQLPLQHILDKDIISIIIQSDNRPEKIPPNSSPKISLLMQKFCWRRSPVKRPSAEQIVQYLETKEINPSILEPKENYRWNQQSQVKNQNNFYNNNVYRQQPVNDNNNDVLSGNDSPKHEENIDSYGI